MNRTTASCNKSEDQNKKQKTCRFLARVGVAAAAERRVAMKSFGRRHRLGRSQLKRQRQRSQTDDRENGRKDRYVAEQTKQRVGAEPVFDDGDDGRGGDRRRVAKVHEIEALGHNQRRLRVIDVKTATAYVGARYQAAHVHASFERVVFVVLIDIAFGAVDAGVAVAAIGSLVAVVVVARSIDATAAYQSHL